MKTLIVTVATTLLLVNAVAKADSVAALGRIEPQYGVFQLAGPSELAVVAELLVMEGEEVAAEQVLARLDTYALRNTEVERAEIEIEYAQRRLDRERSLRETSATSLSRMEEAERELEVWRSQRAAALQQRARAQVTAPVDGKVLVIHAREGERIGLDGLLELGKTKAMYAVAEVYETDIGRVSLDQSARVTSHSFEGELVGRVERLGHLVGKNDILDLDPVARRDARVVEVFIRLDEPERVADLTNLQVTVIIATSR